MAAFPSVPVPTSDPDALLETVIALKQTVEMLTGQDQGNGYAPHVFVQPGVPQALHTGDLWLCTTLSNSTFNIWNGSQWVKIAAVAMTLMDDQPDLLLEQFARQYRRP